MEEKKQVNLDKILEKHFNVVVNSIVILVVLLIALNFFTISSINSLVLNKVADAKESLRPARIELLTITDNNCKFCFNISNYLDAVRQGHFNLTEDIALDVSSQQAKDLIEKYKIDKVPTIIIRGELNKTNIPQLELKDDALILTNILAPYTSTKDKKIKGATTLTVLEDSSCQYCTKLDSLGALFKQNGVYLSSEKKLDISSSEAKQLIKDYNIKKIPTAIVSKGIEEYPALLQNLAQLSAKQSDGSYVLTQINLPYLDLNTNKVKGLVSMTYILDESCKECFDSKIFKLVMSNVGITPVKEESIDISADKGKALLDKYKITKIPAMFLSKEAQDYEALTKAWAQAGEISSDGVLVFKNIELLGMPYKDLTTGEIKNQQTAQTQQ